MHHHKQTTTDAKLSFDIKSSKMLWTVRRAHTTAKAEGQSEQWHYEKQHRNGLPSSRWLKPPLCPKSVRFLTRTRRCGVEKYREGVMIKEFQRTVSIQIRNGVVGNISVSHMLARGSIPRFGILFCTLDMSHGILPSFVDSRVKLIARTFR